MRGGSFRPFSEQVGVSNRSYSTPLQRAMTDFGCERSFAKASTAIYEHYGIVVPESSERIITLKHAKAVAIEGPVRTLPRDGPSSIVSQSDGSFVPIVCFKPGEGDKRKRRDKEYKEFRLCTAYAHKSATSYYASGGFCDVERTGNALGQAALKAGWNTASDVHCMGDGAPWIVKQAILQFGTNSFLLDFYHLCEYLEPAAHICAPSQSDGWMEQQRKLLKQNESEKVLTNLEPYIETQEIKDANAPVRCAHRYIDNRTEQLDYQSALQKGLPIGSGKIESAQGHIIQERIKKSGAAWTMQNAEAMINLRVARTNNLWNNIWNN